MASYIIGCQAALFGGSFARGVPCENNARGIKRQGAELSCCLGNGLPVTSSLPQQFPLSKTEEIKKQIELFRDREREIKKERRCGESLCDLYPHSNR
jgi:hypothetical protein